METSEWFSSFEYLLLLIKKAKLSFIQLLIDGTINRLLDY